MVRGAGEKPAKSSLTSPVCALPDCAPLWSAVAYFAYTCPKKVCAVSRSAGKYPRVRAEACHAATGRSCWGRIVGVVAACVNPFS